MPLNILLAKEGDPLLPSNKRPIALLNSDYKLFSKYINEFYFREVLAQNISAEQTSAVQGRSIHDALILTRDTIDYCKSRERGCLISLDQKKAFDMVDHDFMFRIMERMGVSSKLIAVVATMYRNISTRVQVNGNLTDKVSLHRGVRQGCPLSPTLYVIYVQATINLLKSESGIQGLGLPTGKRAKVSAYADDLLLFCQHWEVERVMKVFRTIESATGSCLNTNKTKVLNLSGHLVLPQCEVTSLKILGVVFSTKGHYFDSAANLAIAKEKVKTKLEGWQSLGLSLPGKVLLVNIAVIPVVYYACAVFLPKVETLKEIRKEIFSFL
jgi:hypothetical protein